MYKGHGELYYGDLYYYSKDRHNKGLYGNVFNAQTSNASFFFCFSDIYLTVMTVPWNLHVERFCSWAGEAFLGGTA